MQAYIPTRAGVACKKPLTHRADFYKQRWPAWEYMYASNIEIVFDHLDRTSCIIHYSKMLPQGGNRKPCVNDSPRKYTIRIGNT